MDFRGVLKAPFYMKIVAQSKCQNTDRAFHAMNHVLRLLARPRRSENVMSSFNPEFIFTMWLK